MNLWDSLLLAVGTSAFLALFYVAFLYSMIAMLNEMNRQFEKEREEWNRKHPIKRPDKWYAPSWNKHDDEA